MIIQNHTPPHPPPPTAPPQPAGAFLARLRQLTAGRWKRAAGRGSRFSVRQKRPPGCRRGRPDWCRSRRVCRRRSCRTWGRGHGLFNMCMHFVLTAFPVVWPSRPQQEQNQPCDSNFNATYKTRTLAVTRPTVAVCARCDGGNRTVKRDVCTRKDNHEGGLLSERRDGHFIAQARCTMQALCSHEPRQEHKKAFRETLEEKHLRKQTELSAEWRLQWWGATYPMTGTPDPERLRLPPARTTTRGDQGRSPQSEVIRAVVLDESPHLLHGAVITHRCSRLRRSPAARRPRR